MSGSNASPGCRPQLAGRIRAIRVLSVVIALIGGLSSPIPGVAAGRYSDVAAESVHYRAIETLSRWGVFAGTECGDSEFCPNDPIRRRTMAVWTVRGLGHQPSATGTSGFVDVNPEQWWSRSVERLYELGITVGCETDPLAYCPENAVTRGQMATFLARAFDLPAAPAAGFTDTTTHAHGKNIDALAESGITEGCTIQPFRFCPQEPVSRAQMASFLFRALLGDVPDTDLIDLSGKGKVNLRSLFDGDIAVMLWFWAPWCPDCRTDAPHMAKFAERNASRVKVVGVLPSHCRHREEAAELVTEHGLDLLLLWDESNVAWEHYGRPENSNIWLLDRFGTRLGDGPTRFSIRNAEELLVDLAEPPLPGLD